MTKTLSRPKLPALPAAARTFVRPMLFAALGLHALLLFTPFPKAKEKPPENKEAPVRITQLPTAKASANQTPKVAVAKLNKPALPKINRPNPNPIVQSAIEPPKSQETASPTESATPAQSNSKPSNKADTRTAVDFPHYMPSTPNCFGVGIGENCRVATANLSAVTAFYLSVPKTKGFVLTPDEDSVGKKIFTVTTPDKKTLFLHLFKDEPTTVILLSETKVADLSAVKKSVNVPDDYYRLLAELAPDVDRSDNPQTNAKPEQFTKPEMFYTRLSSDELQSGAVPDMLPGVDGSPKLILGQAPDAFYQLMKTSGLDGIFQVTPKSPYGGGNLYQLKKDNTTFYMSLVPTKDQKGTIVITWLKNPGS